MTGAKRVIGDKTMECLAKKHEEILGTVGEAVPLIQWQSSVYTTYVLNLLWRSLPRVL